MYKILELNGCTRLLNTGTTVFLCAQSEAGKTITPVAWNMPVNDEPPIAAFALDSNHFITKLILESKEFCVCIPDMEMLDTVIKCGSVSGKEKDKFSMFGVEYEKCAEIGSIKVKGCAGYLECLLKDDFKYDGVDLIVATVVRAEVKNEFFDDAWITDKFRSINSAGNMYAATLGARFKI